MILILGCGYVGLRTARRLQHLGPLHVTTRSQDKLLLVQKEFPASLLSTSDLPALSRLLVKAKILVVTIGASHASEYQSAYLDTALHIKEAICQNSSLTHVLYTSSTSVYGDAQGKIVTEESSTLATSEQGKILIKTEQVFLSLNNTSTKVVIFRLPEIYGPSRSLKERVQKLQGKKAPGDGSQFASLIHVDDIVGAIAFALEHNLQGIYNLCSDDHLSRKALYQMLCSHYDLPDIQWDPTLLSIHRSGSKQVSNQKIKSAGFRLEHPTYQF
jgi:nucleoside-diphosphate-sugar epimerase